MIELEVHCLDGSVQSDDGRDNPVSTHLIKCIDPCELPDLKTLNTEVQGRRVHLDLELDRGQPISLGSRWLHDEGEGHRVSGKKSLTRTQRHRWRAGDRRHFVKVVAITSGRHGGDAAAHDRTLLEGDLNLPDLRRRHEEAWAELWESRIEVNHPRLQQLLNVAFFHLYGSLRNDGDWSHAPCGLTDNGWDGLVFWDTDTWTLPVLSLFQPGMAQSCARYRHRTLEGALANAEKEGETGARWPWMSGSSGAEQCSHRTFQEERHIVSCVALAQWVYASCSGDLSWFHEDGPGLVILEQCARYWEGRAEENEDGSWSIDRVCGPDEHAGRVRDNFTTNVGAAWTLNTAAQLMKDAGKEVPSSWQVIAKGLRQPWIQDRDIPKQMEQWQHGQTIKQADTVLAFHPWNHDLDEATMARTVDYYREHYPPQAIMMGQAIDGIVDARLGRSEGVEKALQSLLPHLAGPYRVASEHPHNARAPFLTGYGGFLQLMMFGIAGLRWSLQSLEADAHFKPCLPTWLDGLVLHGIHLNGKKVSLRIDGEGARPL